MQIPTANKPLYIPDTRFAYTFRNSLQKEAVKRKETQPSKTSICKVIFRDVILMPFLQNMLWVCLLLAFKPAFRGVVLHGKRIGSSIYRMILGPSFSKRTAHLS